MQVYILKHCEDKLLTLIIIDLLIFKVMFSLYVLLLDSCFWILLVVDLSSPHFPLGRNDDR